MVNNDLINSPLINRYETCSNVFCYSNDIRVSSMQEAGIIFCTSSSTVQIYL